MSPPLLDVRRARRLALARAGLTPRRYSDLPERAAGAGRRARRGAYAVVDRFGYLQLDSVPVVGARTHGLVLLSRLEGFRPDLAEELLRPGEPLFEYWGHEASWLPLDLYPVLGFRRRQYRVHPWWGDILGQHPETADAILRRLDGEGPLRTQDVEGKDHADWWGYRASKKVLIALWFAGDIAVVERRGFHRRFDLTERVIPESHRGRDLPTDRALEALILKSLDGHGWATAGTLAATFRLKSVEARPAIERLVEEGQLVPCDLALPNRRLTGYSTATFLDAAESLKRWRPRRDRGVLLSPFDPVLWDRNRVQQLFDFEQLLEIYKPQARRKYGYYVLPILAGERLIGRVDLKAHRAEGRLEVRALHYESSKPSAVDQEAAGVALRRLATSLELSVG
ncbi:MAG: crosslink repair DNA glycosylase YcaQ family protein [Acidobacteriota bacterium]